MRIVMDACTLINLINGKVLNSIVEIPNFEFYVGENLLDQEILNDTQNVILQSIIDTGKIKVLASSISVKEFLVLKKKYNLGDGETESIALCQQLGHYFASDDNKARRCSKKELGENKVKGSYFLLKRAVQSLVLTLDEALEAVNLMKAKGGFLPVVDSTYFM